VDEINKLFLPNYVDQVIKQMLCELLLKHEDVDVLIFSFKCISSVGTCVSYSGVYK
jgi:hypothetical protein